MMLYFISGSKSKQKEMERLCVSHGIQMASTKVEINELQTKNLEELVRDKVKKAFDTLKRPLFVEHTMLQLELETGDMSHFPGALTSIIWEELGEVHFSELFGGKKAKATAMIGYCDGKKIYTFQESVCGSISPVPRGEGGFGWDRIFVPNGQARRQERTFAELELVGKKDEYSMRSAVLKKLGEHIKKEQVREQKQDFRELCKAIKDRRVILFAGAGVSMNLKLPSWGKLISTMAQVCFATEKCRVSRPFCA
ncbi:hypothetical protein CIG75_02640 [Tumebacillus algifaecis]|uniref:Non-canonical purine NTP pyrophosphatase n=1 Tax=Tumebacillus algifaecis TaxID=1214604 RepID=A0A223CXQ9_9BACL|nr:non-canonical purine NTP pyrophosphatase [Tumebacillus algifaecis]ASS73987.1 hypothetical protein CIG75_02640 [Tumebacillus algifaecis]